MVMMLVWFSMTIAAQTTADTIQHDMLTTSRKPYQLGAKTNLLYEAILLPNVGVEIPLSERWTVGVDWFYTWIFASSHNDFWQAYGGYLTVRRYFSLPKQTAKYPYSSFPTGHHLGVYMLGLTYDVERRHRGYQAARFGFGGGVEYGYSKRIGRHLNIDFSLGVGFQDGEYKEYDPQDGHFVWQSTRKRHWWGPTKAEIALVWLIGLGQKGGAR